jgi:ribosomal subunit interface protein
VEESVEIVVTARHTEVPDRFRRHAEEKLAKIELLAPRAHRIDVEVSHEANKRQASSCERVELTVRAKGPVIRAEACAGDQYAALDQAFNKLLERLRRARDRRKVHHGRHAPTSVHDATRSLSAAELDGTSATGAQAAASGGNAGEMGDSPIVIREKVHAARPMSIDDALYEMELVGHDFYLFIDEANGSPNVVYRRKGWSYGVIRLEDTEAGPRSAAATGSDGVADAATG